MSLHYNGKVQIWNCIVHHYLKRIFLNMLLDNISEVKPVCLDDDTER